MKFSIVIPSRAPYCRKDTLSQTATTAEGLGFDSILLWDHYMLPSSKENLEAWLALSYLASTTKSIRLGTCVTPIPLRPPGILAKMATTVDILSGGRLILGVGAGWHRSEFEAFGNWEESSSRVRKVREGLDLIHRLWSEEKVDFNGRYYSAKGAVLEPKPLQKPHPPIWIGSTGPHMLRTMLMYGDGWMPTRITDQDYGSLLERIKGMAGEMGIKKGLTHAYYDSETLNIPRYTKRIEEYAQAGCEYYAIRWAYPPEEMTEKMKEFSREVMPSFR